MSRVVFRSLRWCSRRRRAVSCSIAVLAIAAMLGGAAAGTVSAGSPLIPTDADTGQPPTVSAAQPPARLVTVSGVVVAVREAGVALRTGPRQVLLVRTDNNTKYRRKGEAVERAELHPREQVTVLGRMQPNGRLRARAIALRGEVAPKAIPTAPAGSQ